MSNEKREPTSLQQAMQEHDDDMARLDRNTFKQSEAQAPERIYMHPTSAEANINPWPLEPGEYVEYVRADLLPTAGKEARKEAFREAIEIVKEMAWTTTHDKIAIALEAAATTKKGDQDVSDQEAKEARANRGLAR